MQNFNPIFDAGLLGFSKENLRFLFPYLWVFAGACLLTVLAVFKSELSKKLGFLTALVFTALGFVASVKLMMFDPVLLMNGMLASDSFGSFFNALFCFAAFFTTLASYKYLEKDELSYTEYYAMILFSCLGMMLLSSVKDFISLFIALELMSLSVYVLVGFRRWDRKSNEASIKYFILGSVASAILLYGASMIYGATGSLWIDSAVKILKTGQTLSPLFSLGGALVLMGFFFKVASVPFHMWMPDVYEGALTPVTGWMTTGVKAASFAAFMRVFVGLGLNFENILWWVALLTMFVSNVIALTQTQLKRMLAYSSISHTGYLLVGMIAAPRSDLGYAPVILYLLTYTVMNLGAFVVLTQLSGKADSKLNLQDIQGLGKTQPFKAFGLSTFLISMAGIPLTAGFAGKYFLFYSGVLAHQVPLVVLAVMCSAISVYYYLRVLVYMYMKDPVQTETAPSCSPSFASFAVFAMVALTFLIGVFPNRWMSASQKAALVFAKQ